MLGKRLSALLAAYLNKFICDLNEEQLQVSLWSGEVVLRNIQLRTDILDQLAHIFFPNSLRNSDNLGGAKIPRRGETFSLPFRLVKGVVSELVVTVPWASLDVEPAKVEVRGVDVVVIPLRRVPYDAAEETARKHQTKAGMLKTFEEMRKGVGAPPPEGVLRGPFSFLTSGGLGGLGSYVERLVESMKQNICVVVHDLRVKYVVDYEGLAPCFTRAISLTVDKMQISTADVSGQGHCAVDSAKSLCKKIVMNGVQFSLHAFKKRGRGECESYVEDGSGPSWIWMENMDILSVDEFALHFRVIGGEGSTATDNVLGRGKIEVLMATSSAVTVRGCFGALETLLIIGDSCRCGFNSSRYRKYLHLLHGGGAGSEKVSTLARRRWWFATCCVINDILPSVAVEGTKYRFTKDITRMGALRRQYCSLWKRTQGVCWLPPLTSEEEVHVKVLEGLLNIQQIIFFRCLAYAELKGEGRSMTKQRRYIENVVRGSQPCASGSDLEVGCIEGDKDSSSYTEGNESSSNSLGSGSWLSQWWFSHPTGRSETTSGDSDSSLLAVSSFADDLEAEWVVGRRFLSSILFSATEKSAELHPSSPLSGTDVHHEPVTVVALSFPSLEVSFYPYVWSRTTSGRNPLLAFVGSLQQHIFVCLKSVCCTFTDTPSPRDTETGVSVIVGSVAAGIHGPIATPLVESCDTYSWGTSRRGENCDGLLRKSWLTVALNETHSRMTVNVAATHVTVDPWHECRWWWDAIIVFNNSFPESATGTLAPAEPRTCGPLDAVDICVDSVVLSVPMITNESCRHNLTFRVSDIWLSKLGRGAHTAWKLVSGVVAPISLQCTGTLDVLTLWDVAVVVIVEMGLHVSATLRAELTVEPLFCAVISHYVNGVSLLETDIVHALLQDVAEHDGTWRLESDTTLSVGSRMFTFSASQCRNYLDVLHQHARRRVELGKHERVDPHAFPSVVGEEVEGTCTPCNPLSVSQIDLAICSGKVNVRGIHGEEVAYIDLPCCEEPSECQLPLRSPTVATGHPLKVWISVTRGYQLETIKVELPDLHVCSPHSGHMLSLDTAIVEYGVLSATLTFAAVAVQVLVCHSLVYCAEMLLGAYASLVQERLSASELAGQLLGAGTPTVVEVNIPKRVRTTFSTATSTNTAGRSQTSGVSINRLDLRFVLENMDEVILASVTDLVLEKSLTADFDTTGISKMKAYGVLASIEHIAIGGGTRGPFVLFSSNNSVSTCSSSLSGSFKLSFTYALGGGPRHATLDIIGGCVGIYYEYWMRFLSLPFMPNVVRMLSVFESTYSVRGFLLSPQGALAQAETTHLIVAAGALTARAEISCVSLLIATNASQTIDFSRSDTFVAFDVGEVVASYSESVKDIAGRLLSPRPFELVAELRHIRHLFNTDGLDSCWTPSIFHASVLINSQTRLVPNGGNGSYVHAPGGDGDMSIQLSVYPPKSGTDETSTECVSSDTDADSVYRSDAAMYLRLTPEQLSSFICAFYFNFCATNYAHSQGSGSATPVANEPAVKTSTFMLITIVPFRCMLIEKGDDSGEHTFEIDVNVQSYSTSGVAAGEPSSVVHLSNLSIDDVTPARCVVRSEVPRWQQQQVVRQPCKGRKRRLLGLKSSTVSRTVQKLSGSRVEVLTDCSFDGMTLFAVRYSWIPLLKSLVNCQNKVDEQRRKKESEPSCRCGDEVMDSDTESTFSVMLRSFTMRLEEPWEEPLATLCVPSLTGALSVGRYEKKLNVILDKFAFLRSDETASLVDSDIQSPQEHCIGKYTSPPLAQIGTACLMVTETTEASKATRKGESCFGYACSVEFLVQSVCITLDAAVLARLVHCGASEFSAYSCLFLPDASRDGNAGQTSPGSAGDGPLIPSVSATLKDVTCVLQDGFDAKRIKVECIDLLAGRTIEVVATGDFVGDRPRQHFARARAAKISGVVIEFEKLCSLTLPNVEVQDEVPIVCPDEEIVRSQRTVSWVGHEDGLPSSAFTNSSVTAPCQRSGRLIRVSVQQDTRFCVSPLHVREVFRVSLSLASASSLWDTQPPLPGAATLPAYYRVRAQQETDVVPPAVTVLVFLPCFSLCVMGTGQHEHSAVDGAVGEAGVEHSSCAVPLATLHVEGGLTLTSVILPQVEGLWKGGLTFSGAFEILDGVANVVMYRRSAKERSCTVQSFTVSQPLSSTISADVGVRVDIEDSVLERKMSFQVCDLVTGLNSHTVDFVRRVCYFAHLMGFQGLLTSTAEGGASVDHIKSGLVAAAGPSQNPSENLSTTGRRTSVEVSAVRLSVQFEQLTLLTCSDTSGKLWWGAAPTGVGSDSLSYDLCVMNVEVASMSKRCTYLEIREFCVRASSFEEMSISAKGITLSNRNVTFYQCLWTRVRDLWAEVQEAMGLPEHTERAHTRLATVVVEGITVRFLPILSDSGFCSGDGCFYVVLPVVTVESAICHAGSHLAIEAREVSAFYRSSLESVSSFIENISLRLCVEENFLESTRSVLLNFGNVEVIIPVGDVLQSCATLLLQAVFPLMVMLPSSPADAHTKRRMVRNVFKKAFTFEIPFLSVKLCAQRMGEEVSCGARHVLLGVDMRELSVEWDRTVNREQLVTRVLSVTSVTDSAIQHGFVEATVPEDDVDHSLRWAIYFRKEVCASCASAAREDFVKLHSHIGAAEPDQKLGIQSTNYFARVHNFKLVVSPELFTTVSDKVLRPISVAARRTLRTTSCWVSPYLFHGRTAPQYFCVSGDNPSIPVVGYGRVITISRDVCLCNDITLGGEGGLRLRFVKGLVKGNPVNTIFVKCADGAKVILSPAVVPHSLPESLIFVDPRLSVVFDGVPFVAQRGKVMDYVALGEGSTFFAPDVVPLGLNGAVRTDRCLDFSLTSSTVGWRNIKVHLDISCTFSFVLHSHSEILKGCGEASVSYALERRYSEDKRVVECIGENGYVKVSHPYLWCGELPVISSELTELVVDITHHPGRRVHGCIGTSHVNLIVPVMRCTVPLRHLFLIFHCIQEMGNALRDFYLVQELILSSDPCPVPYLSEAPNLGLAEGDQGVEEGQVEVRRRAPHVSPPSTDGAELDARVEFGCTAPLVEVVILEDDAMEKFVLAVTDSCVRGSVTRNLSRVSCKGYAALRMTNFQLGESPRELVSFAPEFSLEYAQLAGDGYSLQGSLVIQSVNLTFPLVTLSRLLLSVPQSQCTRGLTFRNSTGIPLTVITVLARHDPRPAGAASGEFHILPHAEVLKLGCPLNRLARLWIACGVVDRHEERCNSVRDLGVEVNISLLRRVGRYRMPLDEGFGALLGVILRYDKTQDVVDITTPVSIRNELAGHCVSFPDAFCTSLMVPPKQTRNATFSCLRRAFSFVVGEKWYFEHDDEIITLELLINAFALFGDCNEDAPLRNSVGGGAADRGQFPDSCSCQDATTKCCICGHALRRRLREENTLVLPLRLTRVSGIEGERAADERDSFGVLVSLRLNVAAAEDSSKCQLLHQYDVELSIRPIITVMNCTGGELDIVISPTFRVCDADEPNFVQCGEEYNYFGPPSSVDDGLTMSLMYRLPQNLCLISSKPIPLNFTDTLVFGMRNGAASEDMSRSVAVVVERVEPDRFVVRVPAIVVNALPLPVKIVDESGTVLPGQRASEGLFPQCELPVLLPLNEREMVVQPSHAPALIRVSVANTEGGTSDAFACNHPVASEILKAVDHDKMHVFTARRYGEVNGCAGAPPRVCLEPVWIFRNGHSTLSLAVRCVGLDSVTIIPPQSSVGWTTFATSSATDPLIQVRYVHEKVDNLFLWSNQVRLHTLLTMNATISMKHYVYHEGDGGSGSSDRVEFLNHLGVKTCRLLLVPLVHGEDPIPEDFACLFIVPTKHSSRFAVDFNMGSGAHIFLENRTNQLLIYEEVANSPSNVPKSNRAYVVQPFKDAVTCFETDDQTTTFRLTLYDNNGASKRCVINLNEAAASGEGIRVASDIFVLCLLDHNQQKYFVSVTGDRRLESMQALRPQRVMNLELFIHTMSLYVSCYCVPKTVKSLSGTPLGPFVLQNKFRCVPVINSNSTEAQALMYIQRCELDLVLIESTGIYCTASLNQKHCLGRVDIGRVALVDCTVPEPVHPVVVWINAVDTSGDGPCGAVKEPSFSLRLHLPVSERQAFGDVYSRRKIVRTIPVRRISVKVAPITVKVSDAFLFLLQQAVYCLRDDQQYVGCAFENPPAGVQVCKQDVERELSTVGELNCIGVDNYHIARLEVSPIELELTITRREDGLYDPFAASTIIGRFMPSVERAPISIKEIFIEDVNQRSTSLCGALLTVLWPVFRGQIAFQFLRIIGSLEVLGNPIALLGGWKKGIYSLIVGTAEMNLRKGMYDFLRTTTSSTLHSVGLISHVGSRTAANLSWDGKWLEQVDDGRGQPGGSVQKGGVLWGIGQGLRDGIAGMLSRPVEGVRTSGITGFVSGVATGALGLITHPVAGVLGGVGNTAEFYASVLQEPDTTPDIHPQYVESGRNFNSRCLRKHATETTFIDGSKAVPAGSTFLPVTDGREQEGKRRSSPTIPCAEGVVGNQWIKRQVSLSGDVQQQFYESPTFQMGDFISRATYESVGRKVRQECCGSGDAERVLIGLVGLHNYALHASWTSFVAYTTAEEFYRWVHVALVALVRDEIELLAGPPAMGSSPTAEPNSSGCCATSAQMAESTTLKRQQARDIRKAIGVNDLLKYLSVEHLACASTLDEIKRHLTPGDMKMRLPPILPALVREGMQTLLQNSCRPTHTWR